MYSHKLSDLTIYYAKDSISTLSEIIAWNSKYSNNDIKIYNYENNILEIYIYYDSEFHNVKLSNENLISNELTQNVKSLCENMLSRSINLVDFLNKLSEFLNYSNPYHEAFKYDKVIETKKIEKTKLFEWNPYNELQILNKSEYNYNLLKENSLKYYYDNHITFDKLKTSKEHILDIILKELQILEINKVKMCFENNLFDFDILLDNFKNEDIRNKLKSNGINGILMNVKLNCQLYPYFPPNISFKIIFENNLSNIISNLSYFEKSNWNPTNSLLSMINGIKDIIEKHGIIKDLIDPKYYKFNIALQNLINNNNIKFNNMDLDNIDISYIKLTDEDEEESQNDSLYWKSGVGYGTKGRTNWDILNYVKDNEIKNNFNLDQIDILFKQITEYKDCEKFKSLIIDSNILLIINYFLDGINMIEFDKNLRMYDLIIEIIFLIKFWEWENKPIYEINILSKNLVNFIKEIETFKTLKIDDSNNLNLLEKYLDFYKIINENRSDKLNDQNIEDKYVNSLKNLIFNDCNFNKYEFENDLSQQSEKYTINKITKELSSYRHSLPLNDNSSIFVRYETKNIRKLKALIIGPKGTPYENGVYIFDILITNKYPNVPPKLNLVTTGNGTIRFNPNLYENGKVCLSLLNTWSGTGGEIWNKDTSTLLQVLVSIQSLIFVENPFFNEPGYEKNLNNKNFSKASNDYNDKVRFNNIKWAICDVLENIPKEFDDVIKNHFKIKKNEIITKVNEWYSETNIQKSLFNDINNKCINLVNEL